VNINPFQDMRAVILLFYKKRLSESRASEQNQEKPMAQWALAGLPNPSREVVTFVARHEP
jgi:hypothetical protein